MLEHPCRRGRAQQPGAGGPPAVGVVHGRSARPITETSEFVGRIQAVNRVDLVARVTAFLEKRLFTEGAEVQGRRRCSTGSSARPFEAAGRGRRRRRSPQAEAPAAEQRTITLNRAQTLLEHAGRPAQHASTTRIAPQRSHAGPARWRRRRSSAQAQINLDYTEISAPIDGKIGRTARHRRQRGRPQHRRAGHHRQPGPDVCGVPDLGARRARPARPLRRQGRLQRRRRSSCACRTARMYDQAGKLDFVDTTVGREHRHADRCAARIPNPLRAGAKAGEPARAS